MEWSWPWLLTAPFIAVVLKIFIKKAPESPLEWETGRRTAWKPHRKDARYYASRGVKSSEQYVRNSRGLEIFTKKWLPLNGQYKGLVFYCHGYGDTCTYFFEDVAIRLAGHQYAVLSMDYEGHGQSQGRHVHIRRFDLIVDDVMEFCDTVKEEEEFRGLPCFVYGESMGGAVALKMVLRQPSAWTGSVLLAPMCKIADHMYPPAVVVVVLKLLARVFPLWKLVPTRDICDVAFRVPEKRQAGIVNPTAYGSKPRLGTAVELLRTTEEIANRLHEVTLPLLILHGEADVVTDPSVSQALYEQAMSEDKTFHLYPNSWHALTAGEPEDVVDKVFHDICTWLDARSLPSGFAANETMMPQAVGYPVPPSYIDEDVVSSITG